MASDGTSRAERLKELRLAVGQLKERSGAPKLDPKDLKILSVLSDRFTNLLDNLGESGTFSSHLRGALKQLASNFQERVERLVFIDISLATRLITAFLARVLTDEITSLIHKEAGEADPVSADQQREIVDLWEEISRSAGYGLAVAYSNAIATATAAKDDTKRITEARDEFYATLLPVVLRALADSPEALLSSDMVYFLIFIVDGGLNSNRRQAQKSLKPDTLGKALSRLKDFQQAYDFGISIVTCMPKRDLEKRHRFVDDLFSFLGANCQPARKKLAELLSDKSSHLPGQRVAATLAYLGTVNDKGPQRIIIDRVVAAGRPDWLTAQRAAIGRDTHDLWINSDGIVVEVVSTEELRGEGEPAESYLTISFAAMENVVASLNDAQPSLLFNTTMQLVSVEPPSPANSKLQFFLSKIELTHAIAILERRSSKVVERRQSLVETEPSSSKPSRSKSTGSSKASVPVPHAASRETQMGSSDQPAAVPTPAKAKSKEIQRAGVKFDELPQELSEKLPTDGVPSGSVLSRGKHFISPPINPGSAYEGTRALEGSGAPSGSVEQQPVGVSGAGDQLTQSLTEEESEGSAVRVPGTMRRSGKDHISISSDSVSEGGVNSDTKKNQSDEDVLNGRRHIAAEMAGIEEKEAQESASPYRNRESLPIAHDGADRTDDEEAQRVPFEDGEMPPLSPIRSQEAALEGAFNTADKNKEPSLSNFPLAETQRVANSPSGSRKIAGSPRRSPRNVATHDNKDASVSEGDTPSSAGRRSAPGARAKKIAPDAPASILSSIPDVEHSRVEDHGKSADDRARSASVESDAKHGFPSRVTQSAAATTGKRKNENPSESEAEDDDGKKASALAVAKSGRGTRASARSNSPPAKRIKSNVTRDQESNSPPPDAGDRASGDEGEGEEKQEEAEPQLSLPALGTIRVKPTNTFKSKKEKREIIAAKQRKSGLGFREPPPALPGSPSPSPEAGGVQRRTSPRSKRSRDDEGNDEAEDKGELSDAEPSAKKRKPASRTSAQAASAKPVTRTRSSRPSRTSAKASAIPTTRAKKGKSILSSSNLSDEEEEVSPEAEQDETDYDDLPGARTTTRGAKAKGAKQSKTTTPKLVAEAAKRKTITKSAAKRPAAVGARKSARKSTPTAVARNSSPYGAETKVKSKMRSKDGKPAVRSEEGDVIKPERPRPRARAAAVKAKEAQVERSESPPPLSSNTRALADKRKKTETLNTPARSDNLAPASSPAQPVDQAQPQRVGARKSAGAEWMSASTAKLIQIRKASRGEALHDADEPEAFGGSDNEPPVSPAGAAGALAKRLSSPQPSIQPYEDDEPAIDLAEWVHNGTDDGQPLSPLSSPPPPGLVERPVGRHEIVKASDEQVMAIARMGNAQQLKSPTQAAVERRRLSQAHSQAQKAARQPSGAASSGRRRHEESPAAALLRSDLHAPEGAFTLPHALPLRTDAAVKPVSAVGSEKASPITVAPALLTKRTLPTALPTDGAPPTSKSEPVAADPARKQATAAHKGLSDERRDFVLADDGAGAAKSPSAARQTRDSRPRGTSALADEDGVNIEGVAAVLADQIEVQRVKMSNQVEELSVPAADKSVDRNKKICEMYLAMDEHDKVVMRTLINSEPMQPPQPGVQQLAEVVVPVPPERVAEPRPPGRIVETRRASPFPTPIADESRPRQTEPAKASSEPAASPAPGETSPTAQPAEVARSVPHPQVARQLLAPPVFLGRDAAPKPAQRSAFISKLQSQEIGGRAEGPSKLPDAIRAARELDATAKAQQRAQRAAEGVSEQRILSCCQEIKAAAEEIIKAFTNQTARAGTERLSRGARELQSLRGDFSLTFRDLNLQSTDMMDHLGQCIAEAQASTATFAEASTNTEGSSEGLTRAAHDTEMLLQAHTSSRARLPETLF